MSTFSTDVYGRATFLEPVVSLTPVVLASSASTDSAAVSTQAVSASVSSLEPRSAAIAAAYTPALLNAQLDTLNNQWNEITSTITSLDARLDALFTAGAIGGTVGPIGPQGATGPSGAAGTSYTSGTQGVEGVAGQTGPRGPTGAPGATGPTGPPGVDGQSGDVGDTGPRGATGPATPFNGTLSTDIVPSQSNVFNLGSPTHRFRNIVARDNKTSPGSLVIGGQRITQGTDGSLALPGGTSVGSVTLTGNSVRIAAYMTSGSTPPSSNLNPVPPSRFHNGVYATGDALLAGQRMYVCVAVDAGTQALTWTDVGQVAAPRGRDGADGLQGETGATGPTGPRGVKGAQGVSGTRGASGQAGVTGLRGETGGLGATGPTGQQGEQGFVGDMGNRGITGATGPVGAAAIRIGALPTFALSRSVVQSASLSAEKIISLTVPTNSAIVVSAFVAGGNIDVSSLDGNVFAQLSAMFKRGAAGNAVKIANYLPPPHNPTALTVTTVPTSQGVIALELTAAGPDVVVTVSNQLRKSNYWWSAWKWTTCLTYAVASGNSTGQQYVGEVVSAGTELYSSVPDAQHAMRLSLGSGALVSANGAYRLELDDTSGLCIRHAATNVITWAVPSVASCGFVGGTFYAKNSTDTVLFATPYTGSTVTFKLTLSDSGVLTLRAKPASSGAWSSPEANTDVFWSSTESLVVGQALASGQRSLSVTRSGVTSSLSIVDGAVVSQTTGSAAVIVGTDVGSMLLSVSTLDAVDTTGGSIKSVPVPAYSYVQPRVANMDTLLVIPSVPASIVVQTALSADLFGASMSSSIETVETATMFSRGVKLSGTIESVGTLRYANVPVAEHTLRLTPGVGSLFSPSETHVLELTTNNVLRIRSVATQEIQWSVPSVSACGFVGGTLYAQHVQGSFVFATPYYATDATTTFKLALSDAGVLTLRVNVPSSPALVADTDVYWSSAETLVRGQTFEEGMSLSYTVDTATTTYKIENGDFIGVESDVPTTYASNVSSLLMKSNQVEVRLVDDVFIKVIGASAVNPYWNIRNTANGSLGFVDSKPNTVEATISQYAYGGGSALALNASSLVVWEPFYEYVGSVESHSSIVLGSMDELKHPFVLLPGDGKLTSANSQYRLSITSSGSLELKRLFDNRVIWKFPYPVSTIGLAGGTLYIRDNITGELVFATPFYATDEQPAIFKLVLSDEGILTLRWKLASDASWAPEAGNSDVLWSSQENLTVAQNINAYQIAGVSYTKLRMERVVDSERVAYELSRTTENSGTIRGKVQTQDAAGEWTTTSETIFGTTVTEIAVKVSSLYTTFGGGTFAFKSFPFPVTSKYSYLQLETATGALGRVHLIPPTPRILLPSQLTTAHLVTMPEVLTYNLSDVCTRPDAIS